MSYELSTHVKDEIEHWKARFPEDRQRSAVISALHAVQQLMLSVPAAMVPLSAATPLPPARPARCSVS